MVAVALFPGAPRATAARVWPVFGLPTVFHETEYGADVRSAPSAAPSSVNCTPTTATLSPAEAVTLTVPLTIAPSVGALRTTVGGVVSPASVTDASFEGGPTLPAASCAVRSE